MMRYMIPSLAMLGALGACNNQTEEERDAARANLTSTKQQLTETQNALANAQRIASEAQALAEERRTRGGLITSLTLDLTISCTAIAGEEPQRPAGVATIITLSATGATWRLVDAPSATSPVSKNGDDSYTISMHYIPEDSETFVGRTVDDLAKVTGLSAHLGAVLRSVGLKIDTTKPAVVTLVVNGLNVINAESITLPASDTGDVEIDVTASFSKVATAYDAEIRQRASVASQSAASGSAD
jgi:hypothetical protein